MVTLGSFMSFGHNESLSGSLALLLLQIFNLALVRCEANSVSGPVCNPEEWRRQFWRFTTPKNAEKSLLEASKNGDTALTRWLMDMGTNVNALNEDLLTPLHVAAEYGQNEIIQILLDRQPSLNALDKWKWTPLHYCAWKGQIRACSILISAGAAIDLQTHDGRTPLHRTSEEGYLEIANMLLDEGANPNAVDKWQWTPLFYSAWKGHLPVCSALVDRGANVNARSNVSDYNGTPLTWANKNGHTSVIQYLKSKGGVI